MKYIHGGLVVGAKCQCKSLMQNHISGQYKMQVMPDAVMDADILHGGVQGIVLNVKH